MKNFGLSLLFIVGMNYFSASSYAQNNEPSCEHTIRYISTSEILSYLFPKYGVEASEQILLNVKLYENDHQVHVLFGSNYTKIIQSFAELISNASSSEEAQKLSNRVSTFVSFESIEELLN